MADLSKKIANSQNLIVLCPKSKQFAAHVFCTVNTTLGRRIASWQEASLIPPLTQPLGPPHSFQNVEHLRKARSRLKRDRFLQANTDFADLLGVDKLCTLLHRSNSRNLANFVKNSSCFSGLNHLCQIRRFSDRPRWTFPETSQKSIWKFVLLWYAASKSWIFSNRERQGNGGRMYLYRVGAVGWAMILKNLQIFMVRGISSPH